MRRTFAFNLRDVTSIVGGNSIDKTQDRQIICSLRLPLSVRDSAVPRHLTYRLEYVIPLLLLALLVALKVIYLFAFRIDSDETQHLHVIWGWANGLLPYRDLFDNHSPLFQFLCSPLFRALGERADIVIPMRLAMIPLYFFSLWCTYRCGTILFSARSGIWAALLTGAYPIFFVKSSEFRTDDLWAPLWLLLMLALLQRPFKTSSAFLAGAALGASFATSMKTSALLVALATALVAILIGKMIRRSPIDWRKLFILAATALFGAALVPVSVVIFFASKGALPNFYYCVLQHNVLPGFFRPTPLTRVIVILPLATLAVSAGYYSWRKTIDVAKRDRVAIVAVTSIACCLLLGLLWPVVEPQDILPIAPLAFISVLGAISILFEPPARSRYELLALSFVVLAEITILLLTDPPRRRAMDEKIGMISNVLRLTHKSDFVLDAKGEAVFRRRAFYYALEKLTIQRLERGLIKDDIPERLIATRAPIAMTHRTPPRARNFIEHNYLAVAWRVRVLGKMLEPAKENFPATYDVDLAIPARYTLVFEQGNFAALIDGTSFDGPRFLQSGHHRVQISAGAGRCALIWATASEKGFSPFSSLAIDTSGED